MIVYLYKRCKNPANRNNETAHFFTSVATSTIIVQRKNGTVFACFHVRNKVLNTDTEKIKDKIRNTLIGA
jgi:hypothetical protein